MLYESLQPTQVIVERGGKFGLLRAGDGSRGIDRRRLAAEREAFLED